MNWLGMTRNTMRLRNHPSLWRAAGLCRRIRLRRRVALQGVPVSRRACPYRPFLRLTCGARKPRLTSFFNPDSRDRPQGPADSRT
jgi:hypothetical protein